MKAQQRLIYVLSVCCFMFAANVSAADLQGFTDLFSTHFKGSFYKENKCGENIETLIRLALKQDLDVKGASLVYLENTGTWNFGLIDAHRAREQGPFIDRELRGERHPGHANWGFHVFLLVDGQVLDFDFENQPKILPIETYVRQMFFKASDSQELRDRKLDIYKASVYSIKPIEAERARFAKTSEILEVPIEMRLIDLLKQFASTRSLLPGSI